MATVGTTINLISKAQVRYEGALYTVDPIVGTVALANVHVHGTETRTAPKTVPPSDEQYDYILFRGSDIQDLTVSDPPSREVAATQKDLPLASVLTDPAVIRTAVRPPLEPRIVPPASGSRSGGVHHQYFHPDTLGRRRQFSESDERPRPRNQNFYRTGPRFPPREFGRDGNYGGFGGRERDRERDAEEHGPPPPRRRNNSGFGYDRGPGDYYGGGYNSGYSSWQGPRNPQFSNRSERPYRYYYGGGGGGGGGSGDYESRTPQRVVFLPRGATRPPSMGPRDGQRDGRRMDGQRGGSDRDGQRSAVLRRPVVMYARQTPGHERSYSPGANMPMNAPYRQQQRPRGRPRSGSRQGSSQRGGQQQAPANAPKEAYQGDYDFEKMNAEFELEFQKEPDKCATPEKAPPKFPEAKEGAAEESPLESGEVGGPQSPCYDKTVSFFDRIGRVSEAQKTRVDRADERRVNEETFGRFLSQNRRGRRPGPRLNLQYY